MYSSTLLNVQSSSASALSFSPSTELYSSHMPSAISWQQNTCACVSCACARRHNQICCGKFNAPLPCLAIVHFVSLLSKNFALFSLRFLCLFVWLVVFIFLATQLATYQMCCIHTHIHDYWQHIACYLICTSGKLQQRLQQERRITLVF